jgi:RTA1 like protein
MLFPRALPKFVLYRWEHCSSTETPADTVQISPVSCWGSYFRHPFHGHHLFPPIPGCKKGVNVLNSTYHWGVLCVILLCRLTLLTIQVEIGGYIARAIAHSNETSLSIYVVQVILLLVAPALFAASIYMVLGRLILVTQGESMAPIRAKWLTKIFVCGDVLSFLVQSAGMCVVLLVRQC